MKSERKLRIVNLHGTFTPDGEDDRKDFFEFWVDGLNYLNACKRRKLRHDKSEFARFIKYSNKVGIVFRRMVCNQISPQEAAAAIKRLVPDEKLRRRVFDFWKKIYCTTSQQSKRNKREIAREEARLAHDKKILAARESIQRSVSVLNEMATAGDEAAAKALLEATFLPGLAIISLEKRQGEMIARVARKETVWPILTDGKSGWEKEAAKKVAQLNLGADMTFYRSHFRQPRGAEEALPARKWAKAAVRAIEDTRFRCLAFSALMKEFKDEDMVKFMMETGWTFGAKPEWFKEIRGLNTFSKESLPAWKRAIRKMIRQQTPNLHERPEWTTQRASAIARDRGTPGEIQNAILDDICSALERIAP